MRRLPQPVLHGHAQTKAAPHCGAPSNADAPPLHQRLLTVPLHGRSVASAAWRASSKVIALIRPDFQE